MVAPHTALRGPEDGPDVPDVPGTGRPAFTASVELVVLATSVFWLLTANRRFLAAALEGLSPADPSTWGFGFALALILIAASAVPLLLVSTRWTVKPVLAALIVAVATAGWFTDRFGVYIDPSMLRNALHTNAAEAREFLGWQLLSHLCVYAALPLVLLIRVRLVRRPPARALAMRGAVLAGVALIGAGALLSVFQPFSSLMRTQKPLRYLIAPGNVVWSLASTLAADTHAAAQPRRPIGQDAVMATGATWRARPRVLVLVVGETARAGNWGLNGGTRQTTPELARLPVVNFPHVTACGTNTEVSVPCMFAPVGRRDYDERRIRGSESLLHVLARAGVGVHWRDNQSGCKGVCEGLSFDTVASLDVRDLCKGGHCLDEGLLAGLDARLDAVRGTQVLVLHMLGNHGPSYFRRYPSAFARFGPACADDDLRRCSREEIANAYDNALSYTDHVLATLVARLAAREDRLDAAMLYVSDHGESLGEKGLFLHGVPYAIAPPEQTQVPWTMWFSGGFAQASALDLDCLRRRARAPASHDHLFHSVLGLLGVSTALYDRDWDVTAGCRPQPGTRAPDAAPDTAP